MLGEAGRAWGGGPADPAPIEGALAKVRDGQPVLRSLITADEHIYSGIQPESKGGTVNEALTRIAARKHHGRTAGSRGTIRRPVASEAIAVTTMFRR